CVSQKEKYSAVFFKNYLKQCHWPVLKEGCGQLKAETGDVCDGLLSNSKATVYKNTRVTEVVKKNNGNTERPVYTLKGDGNISDKQYDMVIVAVPLEISSYFFYCKGCKN
ncbi:unnamed protein product, partial [Porites evermanni]